MSLQCVLFQNVGVYPIRDSSHAKDILTKLKEWGVTYAGFQKTHLNLTHPECFTKVQRDFSKHSPNTKVQMHSNRTTHRESLYQPGGLMNIVRATYSNKRPITTTDPTASIQHTRIKCEHSTLSVFNVYVPPPSTGPTAMHTQVVNTM